jgi:hypothetical protein
MIDIKKNISSSFSLIKDHKKLIVPTILSLVIPGLLILLFLQLSGINPLLRDITRLQSEFDHQKASYLTDESNLKDAGYTMELLKYLGRDSSNSQYNKEFSQFLEDKGYGAERFIQLLTRDNLLLLAVFIVIWLIVSYYLTCANFAMISLAISGAENGFSSTMKRTNHYFLRFLALEIIIILIWLVPLLVLTILTIAFFAVNVILGILFLLLLLLAYLAYIVYAALRMFFSIPSMYLDDLGPIKSLGQSFRVTKPLIAYTFLIFLVITALNIALNSYVAQPMTQSFFGAVLGNNAFMMIVNIALLIFFILLEAAIWTFEQLFIFYAYIDFKEACQPAEPTPVSQAVASKTRRRAA